MYLGIKVKLFGCVYVYPASCILHRWSYVYMLILNAVVDLSVLKFFLFRLFRGNIFCIPIFTSVPECSWSIFDGKTFHISVGHCLVFSFHFASKFKFLNILRFFVLQHVSFSKNWSGNDFWNFRKRKFLSTLTSRLCLTVDIRCAICSRALFRTFVFVNEKA